MKKEINLYDRVKIFTIFITTVFLCLHFSGTAYEASAQTVSGTISTPANISIDGYYDDWESMPKTAMEWYPNSGRANQVSFVKDDNYIYIYVQMNPNNKSSVPIYSINLTVNATICQMFVGYANAQNTTDWNNKVKLNKDGTFLDLHPFTYYPNYSLGNAAITISNKTTDNRMEIAVSISSLENTMGLNAGTINSGSKLSLSLPNVGAGTIELYGTSTKAGFGLILCLGVVVMVKLFRARKRRMA